MNVPSQSAASQICHFRSASEEVVWESFDVYCCLPWLSVLKYQPKNSIPGAHKISAFRVCFTAAQWLCTDYCCYREKRTKKAILFLERTWELERSSERLVGDKVAIFLFHKELAARSSINNSFYFIQGPVSHDLWLALTSCVFTTWMAGVQQGHDDVWFQLFNLLCLCIFPETKVAWFLTANGFQVTSSTCSCLQI